MLPAKFKKFLIGATVTWFDNDPLSMDDEMHIRYFFDTKTKPQTDLLLKRNGLHDVSQFASMVFNWHVEIENQYIMSNRETVDKAHFERHSFPYRGMVYPMGEKFREELHRFFILKNMQFAMVPDDHKNKKIYHQTKFTATVISI